MPGATLAWWRPYGVDREAHTAFTRAVHYLSREAPGGSSVDGAYLIESAAQLCGDAFGAGVVAAVRRGARRNRARAGARRRCGLCIELCGMRYAYIHRSY